MNSTNRVLAFLIQKGISKRAFYTKTGISNGYLDKVKNLGAGKLEQIISAYPELSLEWLATGSGTMFPPYPSPEYPPSVREEGLAYSGLRSLLEEKDLLLRAKDQIISAQEKTIEALQRTISLMGADSPKQPG
ncbi:MAG TPA: hypothetical protein VMV20_04080 [Chitinophagaceae bacterium]|nr:hypothetical protein [Chitinophagaceae bacterium]